MRCIATVVSSALVITAVLPGAWAQEPGRPIAAPASRTAVSPTNPTTSARRLLPGTRPNVFTTIQGNALSASNGGLPNVSVRLRDARFGHIVDSQVTDKSGLFAFRTVDPGSYIVELMGTDNAVIAASPMLNVTAGETVSAVVKLPFRIL